MFLDWKNIVKMIILPKAIYRFSARKGKSESRSLVSSSLQPHGIYSSWNSAGQNTGVSSHSLFQGIFPTQGSNPGFPHDRQIFYQPPGKPKNTGVGSLSLLQGIFPTQELNQGLLHCRQILYQVSYEELWAMTTQSKISVFLFRWWWWWGERGNRWWRDGWERWAQRLKPTLCAVVSDFHPDAEGS